MDVKLTQKEIQLIADCLIFTTNKLQETIKDINCLGIDMTEIREQKISYVNLLNKLVDDYMINNNKEVLV